MAGRAGVLVACLLLFPSVPAHAQDVRARIEGRPDGQPVPGALVQLRSGGEVIDQAISGSAGGVELAGEGAGTYRVRVQRIGYRTWSSDRFRLRDAAQTIRRSFRVPLAPIRLEQLDVPLERRCSMPPDQGRRMAKLWDQIETALALTSVTQQSERLIFTVRSFREILDRSGDLVGRDTAAVHVRSSLRPFDPPPVDSLAAFGFMVEGDPGRYRYYAPAPAVLRSGAFLDTHCLKLRRGDAVDRPGWIGVSFEPAPGRTLPDVAGTLWMDRERARLQRLDFRYVNLGFPDTPELTGRIDFLRLPANRWIIQRWSTEIPRLVFDANLSNNHPARLEVSGIDRTGARVLSVQGPESTLLYHYRRTTVHGSVRDADGKGRVPK